MSVGEVNRRTLADELAAGVVDLIHRQGLETGGQLDTVRALAGSFGVAVPTMREALRRLEAMGVVVLRHGSGVYVGANVRRSVLPNLLSQAPTGERLIDLLEARRVIEPPIAAMAAAVRDHAGLQRLNDALSEAQRCLLEQQDRLWLVNLDFHRALAAAAGNTVLGEVVDSICLVHAEEQREILRLHGDESQDFDEHQRITTAVVAGDVDAAFEATKDHLTNVIDTIRARQQRDQR
ncbi:MAG TPA: FCD domain-containing protein [Jiangellaceae bacterium]